MAKAIIKGDIETVQTFINEGSDLETLHTKGDYTYSNLNLAVKANQIEVVKLLLNAGANPEAPSNGKTPLMYAAKYGRLDIAKLLLEQGAKPTTISPKGRIALDYAKKYQQEEMVAFLVIQ